MFKFLLLASACYYEAEKEQGSGDNKSDADKQREDIKVENSNDKKEEPEKEEKDDAKDEVDKEDEGKEKDEDEGEEGDEDGEKEEKELSAEQKEIESLKKKVSRLEKRTGRTAGERDQLKKDLVAAKKQLETKVAAGEGLTEEDVDRRANIKANELATEREFQKAVDKLMKDATKVDKDFVEKINDLAKEVAPIPQFMIGALEDLDNGGEILAYFTENAEEYEEVIQLTPAKMTTRLSKLSIKLEDEKKEKPKKISKVPDPPNKDMKGNQGSPSVLSDKDPMEDWVRKRNQQVEDRRKLKQR